eukprot:8495006-Pyramimonas_sp.AAC.2
MEGVGQQNRDRICASRTTHRSQELQKYKKNMRPKWWGKARLHEQRSSLHLNNPIGSFGNSHEFLVARNGSVMRYLKFDASSGELS